MDNEFDNFWNNSVNQDEYRNDEHRNKEIKNYIYALLIILALGILYFCTRGESYERGDRVEVVETTMGVAAYEYAADIAHAANHEDKLTMLEYLNDGRGRVVYAGTRGRFIYEKGGMLEIKFDDDIRNWWVPKETVVKR
ncbi:MAG: hypothetical protein K2H46_08885 [Muribaculaceae bacterium]|nr:hypothetical protein [Muribaculaceae bacterium]